MKISIFHWSLEYALRFYGLWPGSSNPFNQIILCSTLVLVSPFQFCATYVYYGNAALMIDAFRDATTDLLLVLKFIIMRCNRRHICLLLEEINDDWKKLSLSDQDQKIMAKYLNYSHKCCIYGWCLYFAALMGYYLSFLMPYFTQSTEDRLLLVPAAYPFDYRRSPNYELVSGVQFVLLSTWVVADGISWFLLGTFVFHMAGKIELLIRDIGEISSVSKTANQSEILEFVKNIVYKHQRLIKIRHKIEAVFSYVCLVQFLSSILVICSSGFLIMTSTGVNNRILFIKLNTFIFLMLSETFLFCFVGELLLAKSLNIPQSISDCSWYEMTPKTVKLLLFIMIRTQRPLQITIGKFATLSIGSFTTIIKTAASYLSVLRTMVKS